MSLVSSLLFSPLHSFYFAVAIPSNTTQHNTHSFHRWNERRNRYRNGWFFFVKIGSMTIQAAAVVVTIVPDRYHRGCIPWMVNSIRTNHTWKVQCPVNFCVVFLFRSMVVATIIERKTNSSPNMKKKKIMIMMIIMRQRKRRMYP